MLGGVSTVAGPFLAARARLSSGWRSTYEERNGKGRWSELPPARPHSRIWLHGASVGEIQGVAPIALRLREYAASIEQLVTCTSIAGREEVLRRKLTEHAFLLPHDLSGPVARVIERAAPGLVVISETEIWPNLLLSLRRREIPAVIVNGRISDRTIGRYRALKPVLEPVLRGIERFLVQTDLDAERFVKIGAPEKNIVVTGSSKYDQKAVPPNMLERARMFEELGLEVNDPVLVAGSVRPGEDRAVIEAFALARRNFPGLQLIIAPRHKERFQAVGEILSAAGLNYHSRSAGTATEKRPVLLLDTIGELSRIYSLSTIAFVGGTLVDVGGHNPFEPAAYGVCVLTGPYVQNVRDAVASLRREGGALEVSDGPRLGAVLSELLSDRTGTARRGAAAKRVWEGNLGATDRIIDHLRHYIDPIILRRAQPDGAAVG